MTNEIIQYLKEENNTTKRYTYENTNDEIIITDKQGGEYHLQMKTNKNNIKNINKLINHLNYQEQLIKHILTYMNTTLTLLNKKEYNMDLEEYTEDEKIET